MLITRAPSTPKVKLFREKLYERPEAELKNLIPAANHGRANHPAIVIVDSDEELVNKLASTPGPVGIVDVDAIVKLAGKLPLKPGYLLHRN